MNTTLVYQGTRISRDSKKIQCYFLPDQDTYATFKDRLVGLEIIGTVLEADVINDGKTYKAAKITRKTLPSDSWEVQIAGWHIDHRLALEQLQAIADATKFKKDPIEDTINQFKNLMWGKSPIEKKRMARYIFEQLTK